MHVSPFPNAVSAPVPDGYGQNLFQADPDLMPLLAMYLDADLLAHLKPHLHASAGWRAAGWKRWRRRPTGKPPS